MTTRKDDARKPAHEPKKTKGNEKDESQELEVQELEERIAPYKLA
jgi:hypothetical protein